MKVCKKCKNEYKEDYIYCPKCGQPYDDNMKRVKTPGDVSGSASSVLLLIWNIILYIIGSLFILAGLISINSEPLSSLFMILFGLSLFQIFYKLLEDKTNLNTIIIKVARIVLPIFFIILFGLVPYNSENKVNTTTCIYEVKHSQPDEDKIIYRKNYNMIYYDKKDIMIEESLTIYNFDSIESAYNYYKNNIANWDQYGNNVHLINNTISLFNRKQNKDKNEKELISMYEGLSFKCELNNEKSINEFNSDMKKFNNEENKSREYINNYEKNKNEEKKENNTETSVDQTTQTTPTQPSEPAYMEYLRKCTVMEAYDIVTTGVGNKSGNAYVDAKKTCEGFYSSFGEKDFIDAVSTDWNSEQNNTINGKPLTECIKDLGW